MVCHAIDITKVWSLAAAAAILTIGLSGFAATPSAQDGSERWEHRGCSDYDGDEAGDRADVEDCADAEEAGYAWRRREWSDDERQENTDPADPSYSSPPVQSYGTKPDVGHGVSPPHRHPPIAHRPPATDFGTSLGR